MTLKLTPRQSQAWRLLQSPAQTILLDGGTRSGKSLVIMAWIATMAQRFPGLRVLVARHCYAHAKTSIWHETAERFFNSATGWKVYHSDPINAVRGNGSEIWVGGFDDKERVEKLLGHEYAIIFMNEVSQIAYETYLTARTRLAQLIDGFTAKMIMDCNPPSPHHWVHKQMRELKDPRTGIPISRPELFASLKMNPRDNLANLPPHYIEDILDTLPDRERRRFRDGEYVNPAGQALYAFTDELVTSNIPAWDKFEEFSVGIDFGMNPAAVLVGWMGDHAWLLADWGEFNSTASSMNAAIKEAWQAPERPCHGRDWTAFCDPSGGERIQEIEGGVGAENAVDDGLNCLNTMMERGQFHVAASCSGFLGEVYDYRRNEKGLIIKENDHFIDAARYGIYSRVKAPAPRVTYI